MCTSKLKEEEQEQALARVAATKFDDGNILTMAESNYVCIC